MQIVSQLQSGDWQRRHQHQYESIESLVQSRQQSGNGTVGRHQSQVGFHHVGDASGTFTRGSSFGSRLRSWWPFGSFFEGGGAPESAGVGADGANRGSPSRHDARQPAPVAHNEAGHHGAEMGQHGGHGGLRGSAGGAGLEVWPLRDGDQRWMPDEKCAQCFSCGTPFGVIKRRHHCRLCGQIFCHNCSDNFVSGKLIGRPKEHQSRLCVDCTQYCAGLELKGSSYPSSFPMRRSGSAFGLEDQQNAMQQPSEQEGGSSSSTAAGPSTMLDGNLRQQQRQQERLELRRVDTMHGDIAGVESSQGSYLAAVDEDAASDVSSELEEDRDSDEDESGSGEQSSGIHQFRLEIQDFGASTRRSEHSGSESPCRPRSDSAASDANPEDDENWYWGQQMSFQPHRAAEVGLPEAATQHLARLSQDLADASLMDESGGTAAAHEEAWRHGKDAAVRHFVQAVKEFCLDEASGLEEPDHIKKICTLAQEVVDHFVPFSGDSMDILSYVKIKRIPGGHINDSQCVNGVVFTRDVAHRKMQSSLPMPNCTLALLREPVSFDSDQRLTPLDVLRRQETEFFDLKVEKIADLVPQPQVLMCQGGVSQIAQGKLRAKHISLVLGVPSHILDAVARCTGAKVLQSVDSIVRCVQAAGGRAPVVGRCLSFNIVHTGEMGEAGSKPLAVVEGSCPGSFSTVCLRGGSATQSREDACELLTRTKRTLQWAIRLARHLQLESELLYEMWCGPWIRPQPALKVSGVCEEDAVVETLGLICYTVSKDKELRCSRPAAIELPVYGLPGTAASSTSQQRLSGWAGAEGGCLDGIRDCTLHEWLTRCFLPEVPQSYPPVALGGIQEDEPGSTPGHGVRDGSFTSSPSSGSFLGRDGLYRSRDSTGPGWHAARAQAVASVRALDPPVPGKGEVLCFQRHSSRLVVELCDPFDGPFRQRAVSRDGTEAPGSCTRWALTGKHDDITRPPGGEAETLNASVISNASLGESSRPSAMNLGRSIPCGIAGGNSAQCDIEVWRWCSVCKRPVTPRSLLSASSGWHSFAKFLELLLHNDVSKCSMSHEHRAPCPHVAFRSHVTFFASPTRPLVVGFKWEPVQLWHLHPPLSRFWCPQTFALTPNADSAANDIDAGGPEAEQRLRSGPTVECKQLVEYMRNLVQTIGELVPCIFLALRADLDEVPAALAEALPASARSVSHEPSSLPSLRAMRCRPSPSQECAWLKSWVQDHRLAWLRALRSLLTLHPVLETCLHVALARLGAGKSARNLSAEDINDVFAVADPMVAAFVQRELLESVGDDHLTAVKVISSMGVPPASSSVSVGGRSEREPSASPAASTPQVLQTPQQPAPQPATQSHSMPRQSTPAKEELASPQRRESDTTQMSVQTTSSLPTQPTPKAKTSEVPEGSVPVDAPAAAVEEPLTLNLAAIQSEGDRGRPSGSTSQPSTEDTAVNEEQEKASEAPQQQQTPAQQQEQSQEAQPPQQQQQPQQIQKPGLPLQIQAATPALGLPMGTQVSETSASATASPQRQLTFPSTFASAGTSEVSCRELLQATASQASRSSSSLRTTCSELQALCRLPKAPREALKGPVERFDSHDNAERSGSYVGSTSSFPVPAALSSLATLGKETLKRMWPPTAAETTTTGGSHDPLPAYESHDVLVRKPRSLSVDRARKRLCRSRRSFCMRCPNADEPCMESGSVPWQRCASEGGHFADARHEADMLNEVPRQVHRVVKLLEAVGSEEGRYRQSALDRGVQGLTVPVFEEDFGSIIAWALLSRQCEEQMVPLWKSLTGGKSCCPLATCGSHDHEASCLASLPATLRAAAAANGGYKPSPHPSPTASRGFSHARVSSASSSAGLSRKNSLADFVVPASQCHSKLGGLPWKKLPSCYERHQGPFAREQWEIEWEARGVRRVLTAATSPKPIEVEFSDQSATYTVSIYHAAQCHMLRHLLCGDDLNFARSMHKCPAIKTSGGKSGAAFYASHDRRFLLKAVNRYEFKFLTTHMDALFWYNDQVLFNKLPSALAQVVGVFTVSVAKKNGRKPRTKMFIVQRNLKYSIGTRLHWAFDLKGVGKSRRAPSAQPGVSENTDRGAADSHVDPEEKASKAPRTVLWDANFCEWRDGKPLCLPASDLQYLEAALWNDTQLLSKYSLVDYSLLLAAVIPETQNQTGDASQTDELDEPGTLVLGIIDYLRPYTLDKQLEKAAKTFFRDSSDRPTVIDPPEYARRFLTAMGTFFVADEVSKHPEKPLFG
eukprot:TRINITY_DN50929_c0_g1_i1.p1 TRINITY_DN50929_c0_g1~~TRINITY_DN50929_c0_g1_i1.p1  ORF type:complete len:2238 (+),score=517.31 TRINITY_DN50929_c0_g1_i1:133-6846(+)